MRWKGRRESDNVEDRRGMSPGVKLGGGVGIIAALIGVFLGVDVSGLLGASGGGGGGATGQRSPAEDEQAKFVSVILADTEATWSGLFSKMGRQYAEPSLVLFTDGVTSACGQQSKAVGPFYCPADNKAYLDLSFFSELDSKFGAPGDFARAYVVAHEIGHHVQNLLGTSGRVHRKKRGLDKVAANQLSVRQELQADCYAGVWAHHAHRERKMLEAGDLEEGLRAASAIGDDTLQRRAAGRVQPESWTHGSAAQRVRWFKVGFGSGDPSTCDTFTARNI